MLKSVVLVALLFAGCSSKDDCAIANQKMLDYGVRKTGKQVPASVLDEANRRCREEIKSSASNAADVKCIVAAADDDALQACMSAAGSGSDRPAPAADPRAPEAEVQLTRIGKLMKVEYATSGAFPTTSLPLTPTTACCAQPGKKCADAAAWQAPGWTRLDFGIDEPSDFQYAVESTPTTFTATAVGDPGCAGTPATWVLTGTIDQAAGIPQLTWQRPAGARPPR
jgi:hypothetical protein